MPCQELRGASGPGIHKVDWAIGTRASYFGKVEYKPTNSDNDETFDAKVLLDVDLSLELIDGATFTIGANNVFNTFPDEHQLDANRSGERFIYSRRVTQFGMNGGFYYEKISLNCKPPHFSQTKSSYPKEFG